MSTPDAVYLTGPQVDKRYSISAMTRWRWERNPGLAFPSPITINGRKLWKLSDLEAWERSRAAASGENGVGARRTEGAGNA